jgi:hypothetical protein
MDQSYFLVYSSYDSNGIVLVGRDLLNAYVSYLNHAERSQCVRLEFTEEYLDSVLSLAKCMILKA